MDSLVIYQGIPLQTISRRGSISYSTTDYSPNDISKAMQIGFSCWGYPNEIMKEVTPEELECFATFRTISTELKK